MPIPFVGGRLAAQCRTIALVRDLLPPFRISVARVRSDVAIRGRAIPFVGGRVADLRVDLALVVATRRV